MTGYWNSPELTFFSGAKENHGWQATMDRYRATYASPGTRDGEVRILRLAHRNAGCRCGFRTRRVAIDDVRREDAAWVVHAGVPQVSRWMENCARPYFGGGVVSTYLFPHSNLDSSTFRKFAVGKFHGAFADDAFEFLNLIYSG